MESHTFQQFIRFTNDAVGLERILRLVQSLVQILLAYPLVLHLFLGLLPVSDSGPSDATKLAIPILSALRARVALARRFFRLFRFLENFHAAHTLYQSISSPPAPAPPPPPPPSEKPSPSPPRPPSPPHTPPSSEAYLTILSRTFNALYFLLETLTLPAALALPTLTLYPPSGPLSAATLAHEAQRFWFLSLACAVAAGTLRLVSVAAHAPVPASGAGFGLGDGDGEGEAWTLERERARLRAAVRGRVRQRVAWRREVRRRARVVGRRLLADGLDLAVPGSVVGWVRVAPGTVAVAMLGSTVLTGLEVWERCGVEVQQAMGR